MSARDWFVCSSSQNHLLPIRGGAVRCVENGAALSKKMRHNMGLCCMGGGGRGAGGEFSGRGRALAGMASHAEKSYKNCRKTL